MCGQGKRNWNDFSLGAQGQMQNPLFAQLGQNVLENARGRSREPKSPKASRPWGKTPWFPSTLRPSQVLGVQWGVRDGHSTGFKGFPTPPPAASAHTRSPSGLLTASSPTWMGKGHHSLLPALGLQGGDRAQSLGLWHICMRTQPGLENWTGVAWAFFWGWLCLHMCVQGSGAALSHGTSCHGGMEARWPLRAAK